MNAMPTREPSSSLRGRVLRRVGTPISTRNSARPTLMRSAADCAEQRHESSPRALTSPFSPIYNACAAAGQGGPSPLIDVGPNYVELSTMWMRKAELGEDLAVWGVKRLSRLGRDGVAVLVAELRRTLPGQDMPDPGSSAPEATAVEAKPRRSRAPGSAVRPASTRPGRKSGPTHAGKAVHSRRGRRSTALRPGGGRRPSRPSSRPPIGAA